MAYLHGSMSLPSEILAAHGPLSKEMAINSLMKSLLFNDIVLRNSDIQGNKIT